MDGTNYEIVYQELRKRLKDLDLEKAGEKVGAHVLGNGEIEIPFFNEPYILSVHGIRDGRGKEPNESERIVLCHYVLRQGDGRLEDEWVSYRDFKDSSFFMHFFQENVHKILAKTFNGRVDALAEAAERTGGRTHDGGLRADGTWHIQALPFIPLFLVFYDGDEEFPAEARLLFDRSAPIWLDAECLAVLGWITAERLCRRVEMR